MTNLIRNIDKLITSSGTEVDFENIQAGGGSVELPFNIYEEGGDTNIDFNSTSVADNIVSVVSIEQAVFTETFYTQSKSPTQVPDLTLTFTPKSSSSRFRIEANIHLSTNKWIAHSFLQRDGQLLHHPTNSGSRMLQSASCQLVGIDGYEFETVSIDYLDSPNTTDPITYNILVSANNNNSDAWTYVNRGPVDRDSYGYDVRGISTLTVTEYL